MTPHYIQHRPLRVVVDTTDPVPVVRIHGDLDLETAPGLRPALCELGAQPLPCLIIDLAEVSFCSSAGLAELLACRTGVGAGGTVVLAGCSKPLRRLLDAAGVAGLFAMAASAEAAIAEFATDA